MREVEENNIKTFFFLAKINSDFNRFHKQCYPIRFPFFSRESNSGQEFLKKPDNLKSLQRAGITTCIWGLLDRVSKSIS